MMGSSGSAVRRCADPVQMNFEDGSWGPHRATRICRNFVSRGPACKGFRVLCTESSFPRLVVESTRLLILLASRQGRFDTRQIDAAGFKGKAHFIHANETFAGAF